MLKVPKSLEKYQKCGFHSIGATLRTHGESWCLLYAGFLLLYLLSFGCFRILLVSNNIIISM